VNAAVVLPCIRIDVAEGSDHKEQGRGMSRTFCEINDSMQRLSARVRDKLTCRGTTAATRVPRWRIGERPREVAQEGSTG